MAKWLFNILGLCCVVLAVLGVILPLVPTTPFLLLAAYFFSKGSRRFYDWLLNHRIFGAYIKQWRDHKALNKKTKFRAILLTILVFAISIAWLSWLSRYVLVAIVGSCAAISLTILFRLKVIPEDNEANKAQDAEISQL